MAPGCNTRVARRRDEGRGRGVRAPRLSLAAGPVFFCAACVRSSPGARPGVGTARAPGLSRELTVSLTRSSSDSLSKSGNCDKSYQVYITLIYWLRRCRWRRWGGNLRYHKSTIIRHHASHMVFNTYTQNSNRENRFALNTAAFCSSLRRRDMAWSCPARPHTRSRSRAPREAGCPRGRRRLSWAAARGGRKTRAA